MRFLHVGLEAPAERLAALGDFYGARLGLKLAAADAGAVSFAVGETTVELVAAAGEPFYHFALLLPGDRFAAALEWAAARTELLPGADGELVFDFAGWDARACYFADPAENIVELIAHRGLAESGASGAFRAAELVGLSELGLVGEPEALAGPLARLGVVLWDGTVDEPGRLAFVGERARTLILAPAGRGWLPTGRPAERHAVEALLEGPVEGSVDLDGTCYRIRSTSA